VDEVLDLSACGIFLLNASGIMRYANRAGERMLSGGGAVMLRNGKLCAVQTSAAKKLDGLIAAASAIDPSLRTGGSMALFAPDHSQPISAIVTPIGRDRFAKLRMDASVCVCLSSLQAKGRLDHGPLRDVLGLTPAETRLAQALFEGASLKEIARRFDVSPNTLRVQLSSIFGKTQTDRQVDLIALLARLSQSL
jgi:DNA-binding CsgD family transcriptional regulator